jgi:hypothetical protein
VDHYRRRQGISAEKLRKPFPVHLRLPAASTQPFFPDTFYPIAYLSKRPGVPGDAVVRIVAAYLHREYSVLLSDRQVACLATPPGDFAERPAEAGLHRLPFDYPPAFARPPPVAGEAQEIERSRSRWSLLARAVVLVRGTPEFDHPRLLRVKGQPIASKAFGEHLQHPPGVVLPREAHHDIVGIADHEGPSVHPGSDVSLEPQVEHFVQVYVGQVPLGCNLGNESRGVKQGP